MLRSHIEQLRPFSLSTVALRRWTIGLVAGVVVTGAVVALLTRVIVSAMAIDNYASDIRHQGAAIDLNTAAVLRLQQTDRVATAILGEVKPISGDLNNTTADVANVGNIARSIDQDVAAINSTTSAIDGTAASIDQQAGAIQGSAGIIQGSTTTISAQLTSVLSLAGGIRSDTGAIYSTSGSIEGNAKGIDCKLPETPGDTYPNQCAKGGY